MMERSILEKFKDTKSLKSYLDSLSQKKKIGIGVLASGSGSDFQAIVDGCKSGSICGDVLVLGVNSPDAYALERAAKSGIDTFCCPQKEYKNRVDHDRAMMGHLAGYDLDLLVLAGYMRILGSEDFIREYDIRMINIHPALLPSFKGPRGQGDAFEYGCLWSGYSIHFVRIDVDGGPLIFQEPVYVGDCLTADEVKDRILEREHIGLPLVVNSFSRGEYRIKERKVYFKPFS